ncbi:FtsX-like permease family protein [Streptomyces sp. A7024]|uniref:FtsX-like permease family protein n=1 Tax=Streptomyces coryli TaxID=1128680 RepID=A0A6G4TXC6_9ACTN|nr:FtsX-like permease family protein [Streptomyces coryli]NGN64635.1 FtsX-like permease family protein [Streptomyces coryli]
MIRLALSTLRFHKGGFLASFLAVFLGAAIVMGAGGLLETGIHAAVQPERHTAPIVVTGDQRYHGTASDEVFPERVRLDGGLADELAAQPGVARAVPDGTAGRVDAIGVHPEPGADPGTVEKAVERLVDGRQVAVLTGDERGRAEHPDVVGDADDLVALAAAFGGLSAMVTVFVVAATLGLSVRHRHRELALLRATGATPGQLRRLVLGETTLLAAAAIALAWPVGGRAGRWLLDAFAGFGVVPDALAYRAGTVPLITGAAAALLTAVAAAFIAAATAVRTKPVEALAEAATERRRFSRFRIGLGIAFLAGGVALAIGTAGADGPDAAGVATPAAMVWTAGFALLGPLLAKGITRLLGPVLRAVGGNAGRLAEAEARARTARLAGAVLPVMLATGLALSLTYMQTTQADAADAAYDKSLRADLVVSADGKGGLPQGLVDDAAALPGVAAASARVDSQGFIEPAELAGRVVKEDAGESAPDAPAMALLGVTAAGVERTTAFRAATGDLGKLRGDTVALPTRYAAGYDLGDTVPMRLGDGTRAGLRLVATVDAERGYETALLPAALLAAHTDAGVVPQLLVTAEPGADRAELAASLADRHPGLKVTDREALLLARADQDDTQAGMAYLVLAVVVGYAAIALVNSQILAALARRREFSVLRLIGAGRRQVLGMTVAEGALVATAGLLLGTLVAAATLVPLSVSVQGALLPSGPWWIAAAVIATAQALVIGTASLSTLSILRRPAKTQQT